MVRIFDTARPGRDFQERPTTGTFILACLGSQIVESDEKWRAEEKTQKKGKGARRKPSPPSPAQENDRLERFC